MNRLIEFYEKPGKLISYNVNLDQLSPLAYRLADGIHTTDRRDDFSLVFLKDCVPRIQRWDESGVRYWPATTTREEYLKKARSFYGDLLDEPSEFVYSWPPKKPTESPEAFFERCAKDIESHGWSVIWTARHKPRF